MIILPLVTSRLQLSNSNHSRLGHSTKNLDSFSDYPKIAWWSTMDYGWATDQLACGLWKYTSLVLLSFIDSPTVSSLACHLLCLQYSLLHRYRYTWRIPLIVESLTISLEGAKGETQLLRRCSRFEIPIRYRQKVPKIFIAVALSKAEN